MSKREAPFDCASEIVETNLSRSVTAQGPASAVRLNHHLVPKLNSNPNVTLSHAPVGLDAVNSRLGKLSVDEDTEGADPDSGNDGDCQAENSIKLS